MSSFLCGFIHRLYLLSKYQPPSPFIQATNQIGHYICVIGLC